MSRPDFKKTPKTLLFINLSLKIYHLGNIFLEKGGKIIGKIENKGRKKFPYQIFWGTTPVFLSRYPQFIFQNKPKDCYFKKSLIRELRNFWIYKTIYTRLYKCAGNISGSRELRTEENS
jgi:hypothetical protein